MTHSALYIDFDNIYIRLAEQGQDIADNFATNPEQWLAWLEESADLIRKEETRQILVRKCYLNPNSFNRFRPFFVTSAFNVIDCPPLTKLGKTSADIHMVLDIVEALDATPGYDEFIIFSGDADFTPLLIKLREKAKKTIILSVGAASPAYKSAATILIDEQIFIDEALNYTRKPQKTKANVCNEKLARDVAGKIHSTVKDSDHPTPLALLAQLVRNTFSTFDFEGWCGEGRFRDFIGTLNLGNLKISHAGPGFVYDPSRHEDPEKRQSIRFEFDSNDEYESARTISKITGTPLLSPDAYRQLFLIIISEISKNGFQLTNTSKNVRDLCNENNLNIARHQVNFVLIGLSKAGFDFNNKTTLNILDMSKKFAENTNNLCVASQMEMKDYSKLIVKWLVKKE